MKTLANSLPNSANAEKQLMDNFKAAALSITTLYRSSLDTSKQAYTAGYATCLQDVLHFLEAGVSVSGNAGEEMTIGRVMDWIEARLEAIKSTEEEEEEDRLKDGPSKVAQDESAKEDREKRVRRTVSAATTQAKQQRRSKEHLHETSQPATASQQTPSPRAPVASSPPLHSPSPPPRPVRTKRGLKEVGVAISPNADSVFSIAPPTSSAFPFFSDMVSPLPAATVGSKRRHAVMISDSPDSSNTPTTASSTNPGVHSGFRRKRGRDRRDRELYQGPLGANSNVVQGEDMEVEEDGRERKRVARR
ncbi:hypothetical protein BU17DRAFT_80898 [Hysterangium stoloniferum]|nr:hypothetical protein BU17DRAFT_80898 [Hysterangium stoloniferum]